MYTIKNIKIYTLFLVILMVFPILNGNFTSSYATDAMDNTFLTNRTRETLSFMDQYLYDPGYGGLYHFSNRSGSNVDEAKYASIQAWASMTFFNLVEVLPDAKLRIERDGVLDFLIDHLWDTNFGGFFHCSSRNGSTVQIDVGKLPRQKYCTYQSWVCLFLIEAYSRTLNSDYLFYANSALNFLLSYLWDATYHGFFRGCGDNGSYIENQKEVYGQFWAICALLEWAKLSGNTTLITTYINPTLQFIFDYLWDSVNAGFFESCYGNGTSFSSVKNTFSQASAIYALIQLFDSTLNATYLNSYIAPSLNFVLHNLWDFSNGGFYESCNSTGGGKNTHKNPTYEAMMIWSLLELAKISSNETYYLGYCVPTINFVNDYLWDSEYGGFYANCSSAGIPVNTEKWINDQILMLLIFSKIVIPKYFNRDACLALSVAVILIVFSILYFYLFKNRAPPIDKRHL